MKKIKYFITILFVGAFLLTGCYENEPILFNEDSHAAFEFNKYTVAVNAETTSVDIRVMLVGPHEAISFDVPFKIIVTDTIGTTAYTTNSTEGTHFATIADKKFVIPANSSFGSLTIDFLPANMTAGTNYVLLLELEEGALKVSPAYNPVCAILFKK
jgi:hypothetical protein